MGQFIVLFQSLDDHQLVIILPPASGEPFQQHVLGDVNLHGHIHKGQFIGHNPDFDGLPISRKGYLNISVEETDLAPVQLGGLLAKLQRAYTLA